MKQSKSKAQMMNKKICTEINELGIKSNRKTEIKFRLFQVVMISLAIFIGWYLAQNQCNCYTTKQIYDFKKVGSEYIPQYCDMKIKCEQCKKGNDK